MASLVYRTFTGVIVTNRSLGFIMVTSTNRGTQQATTKAGQWTITHTRGTQERLTICTRDTRKTSSNNNKCPLVCLGFRASHLLISMIVWVLWAVTLAIIHKCRLVVSINWGAKFSHWISSKELVEEYLHLLARAVANTITTTLNRLRVVTNCLTCSRSVVARATYTLASRRSFMGCHRPCHKSNWGRDPCLGQVETTGLKLFKLGRGRSVSTQSTSLQDE